MAPTLLGPTLRGPIILGLGPTRWAMTHTRSKIGLAKIGLAKIGLAKNWIWPKIGRSKTTMAKNMSVSQSSSVMFDGSGQPDGERMVDRSGQPDVTLNVIEAHNNLSEGTRIEQTHDRSGQPEERNSSKAQIRTLLEEQRQTIIEEYREKVSHHELQAAHAEEERRLLQGQLWRQKL